MNDPTTSPEFTVNCAEDWSHVNAMALDFADGVVKEVALNGSDHVDIEGRLIYGESSQVVVHAQMQGAGGTSVRLFFSGVRSLSFSAEQDASPASAREIEPGVWEVAVLTLSVIAEACTVTVVGRRGLGAGPFLGS